MHDVIPFLILSVQEKNKVWLIDTFLSKERDSLFVIGHYQKLIRG